MTDSVRHKLIHEPIQDRSDAELAKGLTDQQWLKGFIDDYLRITDFTSIEAGRPLKLKDIPKDTPAYEKLEHLLGHGRKPLAYALDFDRRELILIVNPRRDGAMKKDGNDYVGRIYNIDGHKFEFLKHAGKTPFADYDSND
jgi:hypothetical protein